MDKVPVITIDGPSGSGKGTLGRALARELGWHFLDSGALYRLVALAALDRGIPLDDAPALARLARELDVRFDVDSDAVWLDGTPVGDRLRTEEVGNAASRVAALPAVRAALLDRQRAFRQPPGLVADGRDMGTVVFPDAAPKFFVTASVAERARRRVAQLREKGMDADPEAVAAEIAERDRRDRERPVAPLRPAEGAVRIDTTGKRIDESLAEMRAHLAGSAPGA
ncbi:MAG: (d)CMP kinase [Gammaproteobacteria bacterium]|nr:MAG: (d)CMP kinase [Gammaproteobacteria bacterium]